MFFLGYAFGCLTSGLFLFLGYFSQAYLSRKLPEATGVPGSLMPMFKRPQKRKPKSISDAELWKREQSEPPADPGI